MTSSLDQFKKNTAQHVENGHDNALRQGQAFTFAAEVVALAPATESIVRFTTGAKALVFEGGLVNINQEDVLLEVYEDTTFSVAGSVNTTFATNSNRLNPLPTSLTFYTGSTVNVIGTKVLNQSIKGVAGQNTNRPGFGSGGNDDTIVFKPNTDHVFKMTNNSALAVDIDASFKYREVQPREF